MDDFAIHHKILSICEDLMSARRRIESLTDEERELAVTLLERLANDIGNKNTKK